jgi:serine/threonine protein kinase
MHIVKSYDAFYDSRSLTLNILMEFMEYGSLEALGKALAGPAAAASGGRRAPLPERVLAVVAENILRGLHDMHEVHQIHRDVKPSNILVSRCGSVKLSDFGLADHVDTIADLGANEDAQAFICSGTEKYMSPERQRGEPHGPAADIWALGLTIAECAVGMYPVDLSTCVDAFDRVECMSNPENVIAALGPAASSNFKSFIRDCMAPVASARPSAAELQSHDFLSMWNDTFDLGEFIATQLETAAAHGAADLSLV